MMQFGYRPQLRMPQQTGGIIQGEVGFDGKMLRKAIARKTVDYNPSILRYLENRLWQKGFNDSRALQADVLYTQLLVPPHGMLDNPVNCVMTRFIRAALNKDPRPIFCCCWTPDGRRLVTGASSGEFTLWNGLTFNFETILQAHTTSIRTMIWSHNEQWMLSGDDKGYIKYWQANMNNVQMYQGHLESVRGLSFSPTDSKFASCSDDRTVRIFDFVTCKEENILQGHGSDVKCVDWHPFKALVISGSKDSQQPIIIWDTKSAKKITTLHAHKNTCTDLKWNRFNGNWIVSSSRDHLCKLFDVRNLKEEVQSFRGHRKDVCNVQWHPVCEKLFVSGGSDGSLFFWLCGSEKELGAIDDAHENIVWGTSWHPLGHMLVSVSNDRSTRFWTRNRPGDTVMDKSEEVFVPKSENVTGIIFKNTDLQEYGKQYEDGLAVLPGLGMQLVDNAINETKMDIDIQQSPIVQIQQQIKKESTIPGLDFDDDESRKRKAPYSKPIPKDFEKAWKSNKPISSSLQSNSMSSQEIKKEIHASSIHSITSLHQISNKDSNNLTNDQQNTSHNKQFHSNNKTQQSGNQPVALMNITPAVPPPLISLKPFSMQNNTQNQPVPLMELKPKAKTFSNNHQ